MTLSMRPDFASSMNWEYGMSPPRTCRVSNCLNTVNRTRAMTSHTAALENMLFNATLLCGRRARNRRRGARRTRNSF
jgi:hypothetical protein